MDFHYFDFVKLSHIHWKAKQPVLPLANTTWFYLSVNEFRARFINVLDVPCTPKVSHFFYGF